MACYVIAHVSVSDPDGYSGYTARTPDLVAAHGGEFIVRGGAFTVPEGDMPGERHVVIRFPDRAAAEGWYTSPEYQEVLKIRQANSTGTMMIIDGAEP